MINVRVMSMVSHFAHAIGSVSVATPVSVCSQGPTYYHSYQYTLMLVFCIVTMSLLYLCVTSVQVSSGRTIPYKSHCRRRVRLSSPSIDSIKGSMTLSTAAQPALTANTVRLHQIWVTWCCPVCHTAGTHGEHSNWNLSNYLTLLVSR